MDEPNELLDELLGDPPELPALELEASDAELIRVDRLN